MPTSSYNSTLPVTLGRALARTWEPGDEVIVTRLDHDANIAPWLALQEQGIGISHYNTATEIDHLLAVLSDLS